MSLERKDVRVVYERVHAANVIADRCGRLGISGDRRDSAGKPRSGRE